MKTQLLCTFTDKGSLDDILELIIECNDILYDKIYVFQNNHEKNQLICTYNVEYEDDHISENIPNTISLHRTHRTHCRNPKRHNPVF